MRRLIVPTATVLFTLLASCATKGAGGPLPPLLPAQPAPPTAPPPEAFDGTLARQQGNDLTIETAAGRPLRVEVHDHTRVEVDGYELPLHQLYRLEDGSRVRGTYQRLGGEAVAVRLEVHAARRSR